MKWLARALALLATLALAFLAGGYWNATRPPVVVQASHKLPGLPPGTRLKVLLLSDTHFGRPDMPESRLDAVARQADALKPDLILFAGDYQGGKLLDLEPTPHLEPALLPFAKLRAPLGVFAVLGNHDTTRWTPLVLERQRSPRLLANASIDLGPVMLAGTSSVSIGSDIPGTLARAPGSKPLLLLLHEGDQLALEARPAGRSVLALAGHTHGGQVVLPLLGSLGDILLGRASCRRGACTLNGWPLHVTSGVGTSWLPIRYGVPPEMVLITLSP